MLFSELYTRAAFRTTNELSVSKQCSSKSFSSTLTLNHSIWSFRYIAIQQLLVSRLQAALDLYIPDSLVLNQLKSHHFWRRVKENQRFLYVCAIALQLSQAQNIPAVEIAGAIANHFHQINHRINTANEPNLTVQVLPSGWLQLELTETTIAAWLQHFSQVQSQISTGESPRSPLTSHSFDLTLSPTSLFAVQSAHARCCSLLQLAQRTELITLRQPESASNPAMLIALPYPIPWLNSEAKLHLVHPTERALIALLIDSIDQLYCPLPARRSANWQRILLDLSQAFQQFHRHCRIWGEVKRDTPQLAQARLGLVLVTQSLLRLVLQDLFNVVALLEL